MRRSNDSQNWGGKRPRAGRPRQFVYIKVPVTGQIERSEREPLTPESDLSICIAQMEEGGKRGIYIGAIWYGYEEALAIAKFIKQHQDWLKEAECPR